MDELEMVKIGLEYWKVEERNKLKIIILLIFFCLLLICHNCLINQNVEGKIKLPKTKIEFIL